MSRLSDILGGIKTVLEANVTGLKVYKFPPDAINYSPAALLLPESTPFEDPEVAFGGNRFKVNVRITVLVSSADPETGWTQLVEMIDPTQLNQSVVKAVRDNPTLNGKADTAGVVRIENVGRRAYGDSNSVQPFFGFDAILEAWSAA